MKRILLTSFPPGDGGGIATYVRLLLKLDDGVDFRVAVAAPASSRLYGRLSSEGCPRLYACDFPSGIKELPDVIRAVFRLKSVAKTFAPDVIHTSGGPDTFVLLLARLFSFPGSRIRKAAVIRTQHWSKVFKTDPYHRYLYGRFVNANVFVSDAMLRDARKKGAKPTRPEVFRIGVDPAHFRPMPADTAFLRNGVVRPDVFRFGSSAGTAPVKRVDLIIRAAAKLKREKPGLPPFAIIVVGQPNTKAELESLAASLGVGEFVYAGLSDDVRSAVSCFDAGFVLSSSEGLSLAAREMMAMGVPVIVSDAGGLPENVDHGVNGLIVPTGDVDAVAAAMVRFLAMTSEELAAFAGAAREKATKEFDMNDDLARYRQLYAACAGAGGA